MNIYPPKKLSTVQFYKQGATETGYAQNTLYLFLFIRRRYLEDRDDPNQA